MKKLMTMVIAMTLMAGSTFAGSLVWGSLLDDGSDYSPFVDNTASPFSGTAYVFLLSGVNQVSWTGSAWNLNGATLLASSGAASMEGVAGTWGNVDGGDVADALMDQTWHYQAVLVTATGQAALGDVASGSWASTGATLLGNYSDLGGIDKSGSLNWQQGDLAPGNWAAVPEPTSVALLAIGAAAIGLRRRIRK